MVLFFDEAESLVCQVAIDDQRPEQYANSVRAEILLSLDAHEGPVLFASNWDSFDAAFVRRCLYVLEFALPDRPLLRAFLSSALDGGVGAGLRAEQMDALAERLADMKASFAIVRTILLRAHLRAHASGHSMTYEAIEEEREVMSAAQARLST